MIEDPPRIPDNQALRVACSYQGGKQRVAGEIVDKLLEPSLSNNQDTKFYDLCCGSGAITIELISRGIQPSHITMLDLSPWGAFWDAVGRKAFDMARFAELIDSVPSDKRLVKSFLTDLAKMPVGEDEAMVYPLLQAGSFGGKQIWNANGRWQNAFFRDYWEPTPNSIRRSPANPLQPSAKNLYRRVERIVEDCAGLECLRTDVSSVSELVLSRDSVVYIDPPYRNSTGYGFGFDLDTFIGAFRVSHDAPLFVSEGRPLTTDSTRLAFDGAKGGISGSKSGKHEEWLTRFDPIGHMPILDAS